jgi:hypothetical protein
LFQVIGREAETLLDFGDLVGETWKFDPEHDRHVWNETIPGSTRYDAVGDITEGGRIGAQAGDHHGPVRDLPFEPPTQFLVGGEALGEEGGEAGFGVRGEFHVGVFRVLEFLEKATLDIISRHLLNRQYLIINLT